MLGLVPLDQIKKVTKLNAKIADELSNSIPNSDLN
jgi:hypothetical protein